MFIGSLGGYCHLPRVRICTDGNGLHFHFEQLTIIREMDTIHYSAR